MTQLIPVFDIGNVLVRWDPHLLYRKIFDDDHAKVSWFLENICNHAWNLEQDRGRSFAEGVRVLAMQYPEHEPYIRAYDERWVETIPGAIDGTVEILRKLKAQELPLYAITNFNDEKFAITKEMFDFLSWFDDIVVSADEKLIKPDPAIFHVLLRRNNLDAASCVFIDDSAKNCDGARDVGMKAIHFQAPEQLEQELRAHGFEF